MGNACCQTTNQEGTGAPVTHQTQAVDNLGSLGDEPKKVETAPPEQPSATNPHAPSESNATYDESSKSQVERAHEKVKSTFKDDHVQASSDPNLPTLGPYRESTGVYMGQYKNGEKHGVGIFVWENGNIYQGQYKEGKVNGNGVMIYHDGSSYNGNWENDRANGRGVFQDEEGVKYEGEWVEDQRYYFC